MPYNRHGGGCCGYAHLWGLDNMDLATFNRAVDEHFAPPGNTTNNNRVLEVILSQRQVTPNVDGNRRHASIVEAGGWPTVLASRGFVLSAVWRNSNSGNNCYQFLKTTTFLDNNTDLPFTWTGGWIEQQQPPVVTTVQRPFVPIIDSYVRIIRGPYAGAVGRVLSTTPTTASIDWEIGRTGRSPAMDINRLEPVQVVDTPTSWRREDGFPPPAPVNPDLPVELVSSIGEAHPATITDTRPGRVTAVSLSVNRHITHGNRDLRGPYYYDIGTGEWTGSSRENIARLRNSGPAVVYRPGAPAPAPTTTLTEFFAHFRSGRRSGPYETMEALREANPRVLSFVTRRILSNGTVETDEPARIPR